MAFGSSYLQGEKIFDLLKKMISIVARNRYKVNFLGFKRFFKTGDDAEFDENEQEIRRTIIDVVRKREESSALAGEVGSYGDDFFGLLMKGYKDEDKNKKIGIDDMVDECKNFYIAGQETTASSLSWTVLLLAIQTDWQDKARKELFEAFGQQIPTAYGISRLKIVSQSELEHLANRFQQHMVFQD